MAGACDDRADVAHLFEHEQFVAHIPDPKLWTATLMQRPNFKVLFCQPANTLRLAEMHPSRIFSAVAFIAQLDDDLVTHADRVVTKCATSVLFYLLC